MIWKTNKFFLCSTSGLFLLLKIKKGEKTMIESAQIRNGLNSYLEYCRTTKHRPTLTKAAKSMNICSRTLERIIRGKHTPGSNSRLRLISDEDMLFIRQTMCEIGKVWSCTK